MMIIFLIVAGYNAGRYGLDRWVIPFLRQRMTRQKDDEADDKGKEVATA